MANNVTLPVTGTGDATPIVATEQIASAHYQKIKIIDGTAASTVAATVTAGNALKVDGSGVTQPISGAVSFTVPQHVIVDSSASVGVTGPLTDTQIRATPLPVSGTVSANAGTNLNTSLLALEAGHLATIDTSTAKIPSQGQALAAASLPVVLTAAQITTLTPPAAIAGFALDAHLTDRTQKTQITDGTRDGTVKAASTLPLLTDTAVVTTQRDPLPAGTNVIGHVIADSGSTTAVTGTVTANATLSAETTKVIGTVNVAAAQTIAVTQATPANLTATVTPIALTKGTQGATGFSIQELKDAGRNVTNYFMAAGIAGTSAEVMQSLTGYKGGVAVGANVSPAVVTAGKTYRITAIDFSYQSLATITALTFRLRANLSGAGVVGSPLVNSWTLGSSSAAAGVTTTLHIDFPDGLEFAAGTGIAVGMIGLSTIGAAAASGFGTIAITGFEY